MSSPSSIRIVQDGDIAANLLSLPLLHSLSRHHRGSRLRVDAPAGREGLFAATGLKLDCEPAGRESEGPEELRLDLRVRAEGPAAPGAVCPPDGPRSIPLWRQYLKLAERAGLGPLGAPPPPYILPKEGPVACRWEAVPRPRVILAADGAFQAGNWERPHFAELGREVRRRRGTDLLQIEVAESDGELRVAVPDGRRALQLAALDAAALVRGAALLISNHRSFLCLGASLGVPVIGLFRLEDEPKFYEPFGRSSTLIVAFGCPLAEVDPLEVAGFAADQLADPDGRGGGARKRYVFIY